MFGFCGYRHYHQSSYARAYSTMRVTTHLLCAIAFAFICSLICSCTPLTAEERPVDTSPATNLDDSQVKTDIRSEREDADEDIDDPAQDDEEEDDNDEDDEDEDEDEDGADSITEPSIDFDDSDDLDMLAKGIIGSNNKKDSVVPCFGAWWPYAGYVYYYDDGYNSGGSDIDSDDYGGDRRNRRQRSRRRRRRRLQRNRAKRAKTTKKAAKKKA